MLKWDAISDEVSSPSRKSSKMVRRVGTDNECMV